MGKKAMEPTAPIGIFDSGAGGLTVLRQLQKRLPQESYLYFADTARLPYGPRSQKEVRGFVLEIGHFLLEAGCKMLLIACNTATAAGLPALAAESPVPVYGMIEAACREVRHLEEEGINPWPVGLAATEGTVKSGAYRQALRDLALEESEAGWKEAGQLAAKGCPRFVGLVESGITAGPGAAAVIQEDLAELKGAGIRSLILGCTHFPFLAGEIKEYLGKEVVLIDPAVSLSCMVEERLAAENLLAPKTGEQQCIFYCSGDTEEFRRTGSLLLGQPIPEVRRKSF